MSVIEDLSVREEANPKGILIPGLVAGGITAAIGFVQSPLPHAPWGGLPLSTLILYYAIVGVTYYAVAFLYGFIPATGIAYLVRKACWLLKEAVAPKTMVS